MNSTDETREPALRHACEALLRSPDAATVPGWTLQRVGRNDVWRIEHETLGAFFVKRWQDAEVFERERFGIEALSRIASSKPGELAASSLVLADPVEGLLVTEALLGFRSLAELVKSCFRLDERARRCFAAGPDRQPLRRCLAGIASWHRALRDVNVDGQPLYDHRPEAVAERINLRLPRVGAFPGFDRVAELAPISADAIEVRSQLIHGDLSLGNALFNGTRIALLDLEDLGVGPVGRDLALLLHSLEELRHHPLYLGINRLVDELRSLWREEILEGRAAALYALELMLNWTLLLAATRPPGPRLRRRILTRILNYHGELVGRGG